ncbi:hypothetical protein EDB89DRAFT_2083940, partial [Lactarius sanguifluus]
MSISTSLLFTSPSFVSPSFVLPLSASSSFDLELTLDPEDRLVEVERRISDDLSAHVKGTAYWKTSLTDRQGGYYCLIKNQVAPVEFANNAWYGLERRGLDFFTRDSYRIPRDNVVGLGWWSPSNPENPERLLTPRAPSPADPLTDAECEPIKDIEPADDNAVDELTDTSARLAPIYVDLSLVEGDVETTEPPSISESINTSAPVFTSSIPITPTIAPAATPTAPMATPGSSSMPSSGGKLSGNAPRIFDGTRDKSKTFIREFDLYRGMNEDAKIMKSPYQRIFLALSFIRGPNVDDWVDGQLTDIRAKVAGSATVAAVPKTSESLWNDFATTFKSAFTNATEKQDTYQALKTHQMKGAELDTYTAVFRNLASKAGYSLDAAATVDLYSGGLPRGLLSAILKRDTTPETFDEWVTAAQTEQRKYAMLRAR